MRVRATTFVVGVLAASAALTSIARADERLDLQLPDLPLFEPAFHLDRSVAYDERSRSGKTYWLDIGSARADDGGTYDPQTGRTGGDARGAFVGSVGLGLGMRDDELIALWGSELYGLSGRGLRGRHRGLASWSTRRSADLGLKLTLSGNLEHGDARGLGPVRIGPGERTTGEIDDEILVRIGKKNSDMQLVALTGVDIGGTAWEPSHAPTLDTETHSKFVFGVAGAPTDNEMPRGRLDIVKLGVERQRVNLRSTVMPIDPSMPVGPGNGARDTRNIDVSVGATGLTFYVDHETLAIMDANVGGSWIESDTGAGTIHTSAFRMRFATAVKWKPDKDNIARNIGFNYSREPTTSPDGTRILADWRLEMASGVETEDYRMEARGGVSWLEPFVGGLGQDKTLVRYGLELEAFYKIYNGVEAGIYHASSFEPRVTGDPWATPRRWAIETGAMARLRH